MKSSVTLMLALILPWGTLPLAESGADASGVLRLDLAEAVRRARENSPDLRSLESLRLAADHGIDEARSARQPQIDGAAGYTRRSSVPELTIPLNGVQRTLFPDIRNNWIVRVEAALPLYAGGRIGASIDAATRRRAAAEGEVAVGDADLVFETQRVYWSLVTAIETERVLRAALASFDAHLEDARNREKFGVAAHNEVLAVKVQRERAELARLRAENMKQKIRADLGRLLDLPPDTEIQPTEPLVDPAAGDAIEDTDAETLVAAALEKRPEREALSQRIATGEAVERVERSALRPQLQLAAGYDYARPNRAIVPPEDQWDDSWDVSLQLHVRLFDGGRARAAASAAAARTEALRRQLDGMDRRIRTDVVERQLDLRTAAHAVAVADANVESAEENLRIARDRYREGLIPSSELLDAETARLDADLDRTSALAGVRQARAALDRAVGG